MHRFIKGRKLFLGGIEVPYTLGLAGHSDADVVLHAICDALLGAMGKGDIGEHFPNSDQQFRDISSLELLRRVNGLIQQAGFMVSNVDTMILAEEPQLKPYKDQMRACLARELKVAETAVNIKAGTNEGMGFIGRREGIAAYATVSLTRKL